MLYMDGNGLIYIIWLCKICETYFMSVEHMDIMQIWMRAAKCDKGKHTDQEGKREPYQNPGRHGNVGTQEVPVLEMNRKQADSEQESQRTVLRHGLILLTIGWLLLQTGPPCICHFLKKKVVSAPTSCLKHDSDLREKG